MKQYPYNRSKVGPVFAGLGILFFTLFGIVMLYFTLAIGLDLDRVNKTGVQTQGTISDLFTTKGGKNGGIITYNLLYEYDFTGVDGRNGHCYNREQVGESFYKRLQTGTGIALKYLPDKPCFARIQEPDYEGFSFLFFPFFVLLLFGIDIALVIYLFRSLRNPRPGY
jgi:hypothetical protein